MRTSPVTKLKLAIVVSGNSQREVAAQTGVLTENRLSEIVCGWIAARDDEKAALACVLKVPVDTLFDNRARPSTDDEHP